MLKFDIWKNYGSKDMAKILVTNQIAGFSINRRTHWLYLTKKLAVSHKEINEINWFFVCLSSSFLRNGSLGFSDFLNNGREFEYWKTDRALFPGKFFFGPNLDKRA